MRKHSFVHSKQTLVVSKHIVAISKQVLVAIKQTLVSRKHRRLLSASINTRNPFHVLRFVKRLLDRLGRGQKWPSTWGYAGGEGVTTCHRSDARAENGWQGRAMGSEALRAF